jgi:hypothetical protein
MAFYEQNCVFDSPICSTNFTLIGFRLLVLIPFSLEIKITYLGIDFKGGFPIHFLLFKSFSNYLAKIREDNQGKGFK